MKKGKRTTIIAIIGGLLMLSTFAVYFLGKIDTQELTITVATITGAMSFFIGLGAKDYDQSHSFKTPGNPPPEDEDETPG